MHPILWHLGPVTIYTYGTLAAAGFVLFLWYARRQAPRAGLDPTQIWNAGIYGALASMVMAKVGFGLSMWDYFRANPRQIFSFGTFESGGTFYGGLLGGIAIVLLYAHFHKMPFLAVLDTFAAALPLGHAVARLGCFAAGCCYGKPTSLPWAVTFTSEEAERLAGTPLHIPLHPTQLYESAAEFLNFLLLVWLGRTRRFPGKIVSGYFILYGIERGTIEFFRGDPGRTMMFHGAVSLMQIVSAAMILVGALIWWRGERAMPA